MNRELILEQLEQAERLIGKGECQAARLRQDLTRLERAGGPTSDVLQALQTCDQSLIVHRADRARLLAELSTSRKRNADSSDTAEPEAAAHWRPTAILSTEAARAEEAELAAH